MKYSDLNKYLKLLYRTSFKNAAKRGIHFDLNKDEFAEICERSNGSCELTKIRFDYELPKQGKWFRRPWAASLDRKDASIGYVFSNCRLVCTAVNIALNTWGEDVLRTIARALVGSLDQKEHPRHWSGSMQGIKLTDSKRFSVRASIGGKLQRLGTYRTEAEAIEAYKIAKEFDTSKPLEKVKKRISQ